MYLFRIPITKAQAGKLFPFKGITLGPFVFVLKDVTAKVIKHEAMHVQQFYASPLLFYPKYIFYWVRNLCRGMNLLTAYHEIPYEKEARAYAEQGD